MPCKSGEEDGVVDDNLRPVTVRILTDQLIIDAVSKPRSKNGPLGVPASAWSVFNALKLLQRARESDDLTAAREASEILARSPRIFRQDPSDPEAADSLARMLALDATGHSNQAWGYLCDITNALLKDVRSVLWRPGKKSGKHDFKAYGPPRRGSYCRDVETALAYKLLFNGLRICLRCHELFSGKPNEDYCSISCRETHRVARWRERKKLEGKGTKARPRVKKLGESQ